MEMRKRDSGSAGWVLRNDVKRGGGLHLTLSGSGNDVSDFVALFFKKKGKEKVKKRVEED